MAYEHTIRPKWNRVPGIDSPLIPQQDKLCIVGDSWELHDGLKIEMHCHSTLSDGRNTSEEVLLEAKRLGLNFLALTDHDRISPPEFQQSLRDWGIMTCDGVEISARNFDLDKSLHLVSYANIFKQSLHDVLDSTITWKVKMYEGQIDKLIKVWLSGNLEGFELYMRRNHGRWLRSANKWFLAHYMHRVPWNKKKMQDILWELLWESKDVVWLFYSECLKREGNLYDTYWYESDEYEPSVECAVNEVVDKSWGIISMAHPNVTFDDKKWWIKEFQRTFPDYVEKWINGVEINTMASSEWVKAILEVQREHDLILTFWSDCHQIGYRWADGKHSTIWKQNAHVSHGMREHNFWKFQDTLSI